MGHHTDGGDASRRKTYDPNADPSDIWMGEDGGGNQMLSEWRQRVVRLTEQVESLRRHLSSAHARIERLERQDRIEVLKGASAAMDSAIHEAINTLRKRLQAIENGRVASTTDTIGVANDLKSIASLGLASARASLAACQETLKKQPDLLRAIREEIEPLIDAVEQIAQSHAHVRPVDRFR